MRSRVLSQRDIQEKFGAVVKPFDPSFVIPRHAPRWELMESAEAQGMIFRPAARATQAGAAAPTAASAGKRPINIEVKRRP